MPTRQTTSLDGTWTFATDPHGAGEAAGWPASRGFGREVPVPSVWQLYGEDLRAYTGAAWYHRAFTLTPEQAGREVALRFDAVDYAATVWVDGRRVAFHEGGYTPFEAVFAPGELAAGEHQLVLRAYDPADNAEIPHGKQGSWYTRVSGPWQPVWLELRDPVHVRRVHVTPGEASATVRVWASGVAVTVAIADPDGRPAAEASAELAGGEASLTLPIPAPRSWSPDDPALYTVTARAGEDTLTSTFGLRQVGYRDGLIYLNGEPLYLRGALDQAFYPETIYRPGSVAEIEAEIRQAKAMGLNMLRKHIKLEDPRVLDACDRLGMLVWAEPACYAKDTPEARRRFVAEIEAMIERDYNHPSIVAWSLYNEEWGLEWRLWHDTEKQRHVSALYDHARRLDPTRLLCDNSGWAHVKTDLADCHRYFPAPDLIRECEADLARYLDTPEINFVEGHKANAAGVPVVVSEFGVWGLGEPSRIEAHYGGRPWWFTAQWAGHVEAFKYPSTAFAAFERHGLARHFGDLDGLARHCQGRMMRALKPIIEAMRVREDLAGYVVTEWTDIEWEANGWLDYFRRPKAGHEQFAWFNAPVIVMARLAAHNGRAGEVLSGPVVVSNHTARAFDGQVRWRVPGHAGLEGSLPISVKPHGNTTLAGLALTVPAVPAPVAATLELALVAAGGEVVASNQEALTFSPAVTPTGSQPLCLRGEARLLAASLASHPQLAEPAEGVLVVTTTLDEATMAHLAAGGRALLLAEAGDQVPAKGALSFRRLPRGESWDRAASVLYATAELTEGLPVGPVPGWEWEGLYPSCVLAIANYMHNFGGRDIEQTSNQADLAPERILAGYFEGWLGKLAATVAMVPVGRGELLVTTLQLLSTHGRQPIGDALLSRLIYSASQYQP